MTAGPRTTNRSDLIASIAGRRPVRNLHAQVMNRLGTAIVAGTYPEDSILPTDAELLQQLRVSRTVLREALKTLAAKGLIEARARVGTRVLPRSRWNLFDADVLAWHFETGPSVEFLRSLSEVRIGIELESAALAAQRRSLAEAEALTEAARRMGEASTPEAFARADLAFHRLVAQAAANPFMASISYLVEVALTAMFTISSPVHDPEQHRAAAAKHARIAAAVEAGDADGAREAMRQVISDGFARAAERMAAG